MRKVTLFIAMSLDGYIADKQGGVGWLNGQDPTAEMPDTYSAFIQKVDTVVMGWNTYHQITTELSPDKWVYEGLQSYVITHKEMSPTPHVIFTSQAPDELIRKLKQEDGKNIWICGGAAVAQALLKQNLIDIFHISIIPVILGSSIRLFDEMPTSVELKLTGTQNYNGITEVIYEHRQ